MVRAEVLMWVAVAAVLVSCRSGESGPSVGGERAGVEPAAFIANAGQAPEGTAFMAAWPGLRLRIADDRVGVEVQGLQGADAGRLLVEQRFRNAQTTRVVGEDRLPGRYSYFKGNDPTRWVSGAPSFVSVRMIRVADGVDVRWRDGGGHPEFDLLVEPGARANDLVIDVVGAIGLAIEEDGTLRIDTALGPLRQPPPATWQILRDGKRESLECGYRILDTASYSFDVEGRDTALALVVDPTVVWSTFLGGTANKRPERIALHPSGDVIVAGQVDGADYPVTPGVVDPGFDGELDLFVTRVSADGSQLVASAIIGGVDDEVVHDMILSNGTVLIGGSTDSGDFPTTVGSFDTSFDGSGEGFVFEVLDDFTSFVFSTFIGGEQFGGEQVEALAIGPNGEIGIAGRSCTTDFPTTEGALQPDYVFFCDATVAILDASGSKLLYGTYLGTSLMDGAKDLEWLPNGDIVFCGTTDVPSAFLTTPGAYITESDDEFGMGFLTRFTPGDPNPAFSTLLYGVALELKVLPSGNIMVGGFSNNDAPPTTPGAFDRTFGPPTDVYVQEIDATGSELVRATFFGGSAQITARDFSFGADGSIAFVGSTNGPEVPVTPNAFDPTAAQGTLGIGYAARLSPELDELFYGTYLGEGGSFFQEALGIELDDQGRAYTTGYVTNALYETTPRVYDTSYSSFFEGYVTVFSTNPLWQDVGSALPGTNGDPNLTGTGILCAGTPVGLSISRGLQGSTASLVVGISQISAPFKGGTLIPAPDIVISGLPLDASGNLTVSATWPRNVPSGIQLYFQAWIVDPAAVAGLSSTAGLVADVP